jgi:hypothetical protein
MEALKVGLNMEALKIDWGYLNYVQKIHYLLKKLRDNDNPQDRGWSSLSRELGVSNSVLQRRVDKRLYKKEWELAVDALIYKLDYQEELDKYTYVIHSS